MYLSQHCPIYYPFCEKQCVLKASLLTCNSNSDSHNENKSNVHKKEPQVGIIYYWSFISNYRSNRHFGVLQHTVQNAKVKGGKSILNLLDHPLKLPGKSFFPGKRICLLLWAASAVLAVFFSLKSLHMYICNIFPQ